MSLKEKLTDKATIEFPTLIATSGIKDLFYYFVREIPGCEVRPYIKKRSLIRIDLDTGKPIEEEFLDSSAVSAEISVSHSPGLHRVVAINIPVNEKYQLEEQSRIFYGLRFDTGIYQSVEELPEHDLRVMNAVRQKTQEFFESRQKMKNKL